jgi:hypothetical protein
VAKEIKVMPLLDSFIFTVLKKKLTNDAHNISVNMDFPKVNILDKNVG